MRSTRNALVLAAWLLLASTPASARPWLCLPPVFDGGQRMHSLPAPRIFWLELLLRQHELCWRAAATPDEIRVALIGNSAVYGFPLPAEQTVGARLNQHLAANGIHARVYNLGFVHTYQVRDAVIIREALAYEPDVIVYPLTLAEFQHIAPISYLPMNRFFESNRTTLAAMIVEPPHGLEEPFARYAKFLAVRQDDFRPTDRLREAGAMLRLCAKTHAESIVSLLHSPPQPYTHTPGRKDQYDCRQVVATDRKHFRNWTEWSILADLDEQRRARGIEILIVNWPVAHEPIGDCYNARYTKARYAEYVDWLRRETAARGLPYLDLNDLLAPREFIDSLHVSSEGHRLIANRIAPVLEPLLRGLAGRPRE